MWGLRALLKGSMVRFLPLVCRVLRQTLRHVCYVFVSGGWSLNEWWRRPKLWSPQNTSSDVIGANHTASVIVPTVSNRTWPVALSRPNGASGVSHQLSQRRMASSFWVLHKISSHQVFFFFSPLFEGFSPTGESFASYAIWGLRADICHFSGLLCKASSWQSTVNSAIKIKLRIWDIQTTESGTKKSLHG